MADLNELSTSLLARFRGVPNFDIEDATALMERSFMEHGYALNADIPTNRQLLLLLYAEWDGTLQVALKTAYFFSYRDGEESVDQSNVSKQYRDLAVVLEERYKDYKSEVESDAGSQFVQMTRIDRR